jgi:hypothetical protein
MGWVK